MSFSALFSPKSIAIIGASRKEKTVGNDIVKNLVNQGYSGSIYPINPHAERLHSLPVLKSATEIQEDVDLAIFAIPAQATLPALKEAESKNIKAVIVVSAGWKEAGNQEMEQELVDYCKEKNITLIGPNCLGVINPEIHMNASFASQMPSRGSVAFFSQSGALCTTVLDLAKQKSLGFSKFLSVGNKAMISELELFDYFLSDESTQVIALYAEQLTNASAIISKVKELQSLPNPKPVIVLKSGKTTEGASAVSSHTGSLSGGDATYEALFKQSGMIRANTIDELFNLIQLFSKYPSASLNNTAIITNAGGPGVLTTDAVVENGVALASLSPTTSQSLKDYLPKAASTHNPIDILGDASAERYKKTLSLVASDDLVDSIIVLLTPQSMTEVEETAMAIVEISRTTNKPIITCLMGDSLVNEGKILLRNAGLMITDFPESAAVALSKKAFFSKHLHKTPTTSMQNPHHLNQEKNRQINLIFQDALSRGKTAFPEADSVSIMKTYGFPLLPSVVLTNPNDIKEKLSDFKDEKSRFALKIVSQDILHKSDVGGIILDVSKDLIEEKYHELITVVKNNKPEAHIEGVLVMEMAPNDGIEIIVGLSQTLGLGTTIMVGLGGIFVEIFKDVQLGFTPLSESMAEEMIRDLQSFPLLNGARGGLKYDTSALINTLLQMSQLATDFPQISEVDINPLLVLPENKGVLVLDSRIILSDKSI